MAVLPGRRRPRKSYSQSFWKYSHSGEDKRMDNKFMSVFVLLLSVVVGCSTASTPIKTDSSNENTSVLANNSPAATKSDLDSLNVGDKGPKKTRFVKNMIWQRTLTLTQ